MYCIMCVHIPKTSSAPRAFFALSSFVPAMRPCSALRVKNRHLYDNDLSRAALDFRTEPLSGSCACSLLGAARARLLPAAINTASTQVVPVCLPLSGRPNPSAASVSALMLRSGEHGSRRRDRDSFRGALGHRAPRNVWVN